MIDLVLLLYKFRFTRQIEIIKRERRMPPKSNNKKGRVIILFLQKKDKRYDEDFMKAFGIL